MRGRVGVGAGAVGWLAQDRVRMRQSVLLEPIAEDLVLMRRSLRPDAKSALVGADDRRSRNNPAEPLAFEVRVMRGQSGHAVGDGVLNERAGVEGPQAEDLGWRYVMDGAGLGRDRSAAAEVRGGGLDPPPVASLDEIAGSDLDHMRRRRGPRRVEIDHSKNFHAATSFGIP